MVDYSNGSVIIKNVSGASYSVSELAGLSLDDQETLELIDASSESRYADYDEAKSIIEDSVYQLAQDVVAGDVEVVQSIPPRRRPGNR